MADPLEELKKISAAERDASQGEAAEQAREAAKAREKEQREAREKKERAARAPGFFRSMRFFGLAMSGLVALVFFVSAALEEHWWNWQIVGGVLGAWAMVAALFGLDAATWRGRLPFKLVGFQTIGGKDDTSASRVPWLAFELELRFVDSAGAQRGTEPLARTMEILGNRINRAMQKDSEADFSGGRVWRVTEAGVLRGEATLQVYTTRLIEKWLRREVRLLHAAYPVAEVIVRARYTGSSYMTSSD